MNKHLGGEIKRTANLIHRQLCALSSVQACGTESVTGVQGMILCQIAKGQDGKLLQRELEKVFGIRRSTVAVTLKTMERNGLIRRVAVEGDGRMKKIALTPAGVEQMERLERQLEQMEQQLRRGLTQEEIERFLDTLHKIDENLLAGGTLPPPEKL